MFDQLRWWFEIILLILDSSAGFSGTVGLIPLGSFQTILLVSISFFWINGHLLGKRWQSFQSTVTIKSRFPPQEKCAREIWERIFMRNNDVVNISQIFVDRIIYSRLFDEGTKQSVNQSEKSHQQVKANKSIRIS